MSNTVKVRAPKANTEVEFQIEIGSNLQEATELFSEAVVFYKWTTQCETDAGNVARSLLNGSVRKDGTVVPGKSPAEVIEAMKSWKPSLRGAGVKAPANPIEQMAKMLEGKTPEEKQAIAAQLLAKLGISTEA